ncbi:MAG TPA: hypothetical protein VL242_29300 [Sorangium sp.]|nr:hypothetical protein [Sorangium sp.]
MRIIKFCNSSIIAAGNSQTFTSTHNWDVTACDGTWKVEADLMNYLAESDETNNISYFPN